MTSFKNGVYGLEVKLWVGTIHTLLMESDRTTSLGNYLHLSSSYSIYPYSVWTIPGSTYVTELKLSAGRSFTQTMDRSEPTQNVSGNSFKLVGRSTAGVHEKGWW